MQEDHDQDARSSEQADTASVDGRGVPPGARDAESYDPYNTGSFRVLGSKPVRRTLDDMRKLDAEIKRTWKG